MTHEQVTGEAAVGIVADGVNVPARTLAALAAEGKGNKAQAGGYAASASLSLISVALRGLSMVFASSGMAPITAATMTSIGWCFGIAGSAVGLGSDIADRTDQSRKTDRR